MAARAGVGVICQKPMAPDLKTAVRMTAACRQASVPFFVHENWRYQSTAQELKRVLRSGVIGKVFRARIDMNSGFPLFENQPFLKTLKQFIITDLGSHTLDAARFLFGEAKSVYCQTAKVHADIAGEDVATILLGMKSGASVSVNMAYAGTPLEHEAFPQTSYFVEGEKGSIIISPDYWIRVTTSNGTHARRVPPKRYAWANPAYDAVHASIVDCNRAILRALQGRAASETTGADNLETVRLVFASYDSAKRGRVVKLD